MSFDRWISSCLTLGVFSSFHFTLMSFFWTFCHLQVKAGDLT